MAWTYSSVSDNSKEEVDFLFSDAVDFLFSDGLDFVFVEQVEKIAWSNLAKNTASYTYLSKN